MEVITSLTDQLSIWRVVSSRFLTMDAIKIYIGSAGSIPARQVVKDDNKIRYLLPKPS